MSHKLELNPPDNFTTESFSRKLADERTSDADFASVQFYRSDQSYSQLTLAMSISEVAADILNDFGEGLDLLEKEPDQYQNKGNKIYSPSPAAINIKTFLSQFCEQTNNGSFASYPPEIALCSLKTSAPFCPHYSLRDHAEWGPICEERQAEYQKYPFFSHSYFSPTRLNTIAMDTQAAMAFDMMKDDWSEYFKAFDIVEFSNKLIQKWTVLMDLAQTLLFDSTPSDKKRPENINYFTR